MRRILFWLLVCTGLAWARPTLPEVLSFGEKLRLRQQAGDLRGVLEQVHYSPELGWIYLEQALAQTHPNSSLLTLVARGLQLSGDGRGLAALKDRLDTRLAGLDIEGAPTVDIHLQLEGVDWQYWGIPTARRLLDVGNYRQLLGLMSAYQSYLQDAGLPRAAADLQAGEYALLGGEFQLAGQGRQQLTEWAQSLADPEELALLNAVLLESAQRAGMPLLENELEPLLEQSLEALPLAQRAPYRFVLETQRLRQLLRASPELDWLAVKRQHERAWLAIRDFHPAAEQPARSRLWMRSGGLWLTFLNQAQNNGVESEEVTRLLLADERELLRLSLEAMQSGTYAPQLSSLAMLLDLHIENFRRGRESRHNALRMVELTQSSQNYLQAWLSEEQAVLQASLPSALQNRLGPGFQLDLLSGELSLIEARAAVLQLNLLKDSAGSESTAWQLRAQRAAARASQDLGHQGLSDSRWTLLVWLAERHPPKWQQSSESLLDQLRQESEKCHDRPGLIQVWARRGKLQADLQEVSSAVQSLEQAIFLLEAYLNDLGGGLGVRQAYASTYQLLARLQLQQGKNEQALDTLGRQVHVQSAELAAQALGRRPEMASAQQLSLQNQALQQQLVVQKSWGLASLDTERLLASNQGEFQRALDDIRRHNPNFESVLAVRPLLLSQWQKSIPADTTLVQYFPAQDALYLFVVTAQDLKIRRVAVTSQELTRSAIKVRHLLANFPLDDALVRSFSWTHVDSPGYARHTLPLLQELQRLYGWLVRPLEGDLGERPVLAIIPSGALYYVPFPALIRSLGPEHPEFLAQRLQCVNLVKTADVMALAQPSLRAGSAMLALANPDGTLPGAEREVGEIVKGFPGSQVRIGAAAGAASLYNLPEGTGYLHLATHGHLQTRQPIDSYLVVAGQGEAGKLRFCDIYGLSLEGVRLVGLSACETAVQEGEMLGVDVISLAQAFSLVGGRAVLASLWSVSDEGTEQLMVAFYRAVAQHKTLAQALQIAQLRMIAQPNFSHPFYWAAFPLFGDWR